MMMTAEEIRRSFKEAKNQASQVKILAELNACTKEQILEIVGSEAQKPEAQKPEAQAAGAQATGKRPGRPKKFKLEEPVKEETTKEIKTEMEVQTKPEEAKKVQAAAVIIPEDINEQAALEKTICLLFKQLDMIDKNIRELEGKYRETERAIKVLTEIGQEKENGKCSMQS